MIGEFVEVESGKRSDRVELTRALALCRVHAATLAVAKVDRLTRSVSFLHQVLGAGVDVRFCDLPALEGPTGRFMLSQMAAVAELEAGLISQRTKAALAAAKARGVRLGGDRGHARTDAWRARAALGRKADARAQDLLPVVAEIRRAGIVSLVGIGRELTRRGIPTAAGRALWRHQQVANLLTRPSQLSSPPPRVNTVSPFLVNAACCLVGMPIYGRRVNATRSWSRTTALFEPARCQRTRTEVEAAEAPQ
jgi:DNA invertase Pin-like site-specific DNA recombinase